MVFDIRSRLYVIVDLRSDVNIILDAYSLESYFFV